MNFAGYFDQLVSGPEVSAAEGQVPAATAPPLVPGEPPTAIGDFERLVQMAAPLSRTYDDICSAEWEASPIGWIRQVSSAYKRGKIGEELVRAWAESEGLQVGGRGTRGHDCMIEGMKVEVKTSLRWNNGRLVFLGLKDFDYEAVALLGLEPSNARLWIVPKELLWSNAQDQRRGAEGVGSKWLSFPASEQPAWLSHWGGSFAEARNAVHRVPEHVHKREPNLGVPKRAQEINERDVYLNAPLESEGADVNALTVVGVLVLLQRAPQLSVEPIRDNPLPCSPLR